MRSYSTTVEIDAPVHTVWEATCDIGSWPAITPTMLSIVRDGTGPLAVGSTARVRQPKAPPATWTIRELRPETVFTWGTGGPGYEIVARHVLTPGAGGTSLLLDLTMTGPLTPLLWLLTGSRARAAVDTEAAGFRRHCEATSA